MLILSGILNIILLLIVISHKKPLKQKNLKQETDIAYDPFGKRYFVLGVGGKGIRVSNYRDITYSNNYPLLSGTRDVPLSDLKDWVLSIDLQVKINEIKANREINY